VPYLNRTCNDIHIELSDDKLFQWLYNKPVSVEHMFQGPSKE